MAAKEKSFSFGFEGFAIGYNRTQIYDSTKKYYEEIGRKDDLKTDYTAGFSVACILRVEVGMDLKEVWNFVIKVFE